VTRDPRYAETEPLERKPREESGDPIAFRNGKVRMSIPLTTVLSALTLAACTAWGVTERIISNRTAEANAEMESVRKRLETNERDLNACKQELAVSGAVLAQINANLVELKTRVAEVQVTLMRDRHP
jgi:hypothetical protein